MGLRLSAPAAVGPVPPDLPGAEDVAIPSASGTVLHGWWVPGLAVDILVLESVYPDIDAALANRLRTGLGRVAGPLLAPLLAPAFKLLLPPVLGVRPDELRPIDRIGMAKAPVLVASGTADDRTPLAEARALFDRAPDPKRFWAVEGAAHVDLERYGPAEYWRNVLPFLAQHMRRAD